MGECFQILQQKETQFTTRNGFSFNCEKNVFSICGPCSFNQVYQYRDEAQRRKADKGTQSSRRYACGSQQSIHESVGYFQRLTNIKETDCGGLRASRNANCAVKTWEWSGDVLLLVTVTITEHCYKTAMSSCLHVSSSMCILLHAKNIIQPLVIHHVPISDSHLCFLNWDRLVSGHLVWLRKSNTPCSLQIICQHNSLQLWR